MRNLLRREAQIPGKRHCSCLGPIGVNFRLSGIIDFSRPIRGGRNAALVVKPPFYPDSVRVLRVTGRDSGDLDPIAGAVGNPENLWPCRGVALTLSSRKPALPATVSRIFMIV